jgi:hypothetical protein
MFSIIVCHCCHAGWNDYQDILAAALHRLISWCAIIGAVCRHLRDIAWDQLTQWSHLRRVTYILLSQCRGYNHPAIGIHCQMQFAPSAPCPHSMLVLQLFASAVHFQSGAIDQQMQRPVRQTAWRN